MTKTLKIIIYVVAVVSLLVLSVNIRKLDEYKAENKSDIINIEEYSKKFWSEELPHACETATEYIILENSLKTDPENTCNNYGNKLGISKTWYFMTRGKGTVSSISEEYFTVILNDNITIKLATDFIFGNDVRDCSGLIDIDDFVNMTDFNNVSVELNTIVKTEVIGNLKSGLKEGTGIDFCGAFHVNIENPDFSQIRIIPINVSIY